MNNPLKKIFLVPWYGPWPHWFSYFLKSCRMNPSFDWLFFTDNVVPDDLPENVFIQKVNLDELSKKASALLGFDINIVHPYKLVDLKPAYGLIFNEHIRDYDFWGYTDIDLIYGNLKHFLPDKLISRYDVVSPSADFIPGHFCLFRNTGKINNLFRTSQTWEMVFTDPKCYFFDEFIYDNGIPPSDDSVYDYIRKKSQQHIREKQLLRQSPFKRLRKKLTDRLDNTATHLKDFNSVIKYVEANREIKVYRKNIYRDEIMNLIESKKTTEVTWENGRLSEHDSEIMYFHFQLSKYSYGMYFREIQGRQDCFSLHIDLSGWQ